jgi:hypothetical protein
MCRSPAFALLFVKLDSRRKALASARAESSDASSAAGKARRRALGDCEVAVGEYDAELGARQAEYDAALVAHTELLANIQVGKGGGWPCWG